ncbi:MAG: UTRA domain-containing protein, partial [Paracoccaceae bacterium]
RPYVLEDRWINMLAVPDIKGVDFNLISANEWLVANVRYSHGDILFSARSADATLAERLGADVHDALFVIERNTWDEDTSITSAQLIYAPGHHMRTTI